MEKEYLSAHSSDQKIKIPEEREGVTDMIDISYQLDMGDSQLFRKLPFTI